ncbi:MAG TPA: YdiU family protein [Pirellulaceae bacterium]|jgi:uncharacterized protein YdiU (UPF0061 family)|nr:YdiU family protein [Pirellulaceae bacterium]
MDLSALKFDNRFTRELPGDPDTSNRTRQVRGACYSRVLPAQVSNPRVISYSREVADLLDLSGDPFESKQFAQVFGGNAVLLGMNPHAACYGGHQFGQWAGQLGDGRAINLGEVVNRRGEHWTLQLKGAGPTPYSRSADGLAVLRSSVREFLCSEAMHHLGAPTTRALSLVGTGERVVRDMFYDGHPQLEPGAIVCRVAPTFIRFGSFEIFARRGEFDTLRQLADFTIRTEFPHLGEPSPAVYVAWFHEVCRRTAEMIVHWMRVGFVHGVMNTDNMSILGLTIDYGPYGWLESYDPDWTPNTTDAGRRLYAYGRQPQIAMWNLARLAEAVLPLAEDIDALRAGLESYWSTFQSGWDETLARKLGLPRFESDEDRQLASDLQEVLQTVETDMTIFFRALATLSCEGDAEPTDEELIAPISDAHYVPDELTAENRSRLAGWLRRYRQRVRALELSDAERRERMNGVNPKYVLRNYLAQLAIDKAEQGDDSLVNEMLDVLRRPYDEQPGKEEFAAKRPDWARVRAGCSMLSCSS